VGDRSRDHNLGGGFNQETTQLTNTPAFCPANGELSLEAPSATL